MPAEVEPKYTLREAKKILKLQECRWHGHSLEFLTNGANPDPLKVWCNNCETNWRVVKDE